MTLGPKSMACLRLAALPKMSAEWRAGYEDSCRQFSEKADKGRAALGLAAETGRSADARSPVVVFKGPAFLSISTDGGATWTNLGELKACRIGR